MLGVVLWSDETDRKAVIWCEDQGDLAYWRCESETHTHVPFDAGDLVQFEMEVMPTMRKARNPRLVIEQACRSLPQALRATSAKKQHPTSKAQIIPFGRRSKANCDKPAVMDLRKRKNG